MFDGCARCFTCIYADVNGLHAVNNKYGHAVGDEMLRTVARIMGDALGWERGYRVGGDEYVFFVAEASQEEIDRRLAAARAEIRSNNYHVALGVETMDKKESNAIGLIRHAEANMYEDKRAYYEKAENNRRGVRRV